MSNQETKNYFNELIYIFKYEGLIRNLLIQYKFNDGTIKQVCVTDELYALHLELLQEEKRNHWKETRRHISLDYLMEQGADIADHRDGDPLSALIEKTDDEKLKNALSYL